MPKVGPEIPAPLVFRVVPTEDGAAFTWLLDAPADGTVLARGGVYERRRDAKEAIRTIVRHAGHAQLSDET